MKRWEYTYVSWEGSATTTANGQLGQTTPPIGDEVMDEVNALAAEGWEIDEVTAAPLTSGWISPRGGTAAAGSPTRSTTSRCCAVPLRSRTQSLWADSKAPEWEPGGSSWPEGRMSDWHRGDLAPRVVFGWPIR